MATLGERVIAALSPCVGAMVADTCVRGAALSAGKTADELTGEDLPALESSMHRLLSRVAPATVIDDLLQQLESGK